MLNMLNEFFQQECRDYKFSLGKLETLQKDYEVLYKRMQELKRNVESSEAIKKISAILIEAEKLPNLEEALFHHSLDEKVLEFLVLEMLMNYVSNYISFLRKRLKSSQEILFSYISRASDDYIEFSFRKENKIALRIFILYYSDYYNFVDHRNVIEVENCQLDKTFMQNYLAKGEEAEALAFKWFKNEAKKYKI